MSNSYEELSYCGIFCGRCKNYKKNMNCQGCRNETELLDDCPTRVCAEKKGFLHCGQCAEFPCVELNEFYHDGNSNHLLAYENMQCMIQEGVDCWLKQQQENNMAKGNGVEA